MLEKFFPGASRRGAYVSALTLLSLAASAVDATAQSARFHNLTPFPRHEWGTATIPFAQGEWMPGEHFAPVGFPGLLEPFGATWSDGSVRYARLTTKLNLTPGELVEVPVQQVTNPPAMLSFQPGPWTAAALPNFQVDVYAEFGGTVHVAPFQLHSVVRSSPARQTLLYRGRIPNCELIYDLWVNFYSWQDHATFELRVTHGDTSSIRWRRGFKSLGIVVHEAAPFVAYSTYHRLLHTPIQTNGATSIALIHESAELYDGQAVEYFGTFMFANPEIPLPDATERIYSALASAYEPLVGVATNWPESGAFGPFGKVPEAPPWFSSDGRSEADYARSQWLSVVTQPAPLWADRRPGLQPASGSTGAQNDFGTTRFGDIFRFAQSHRIAEIRWAAGEEAMRPTHFREPNGDPVLASNHPQWVAWNGRTHADPTVSVDRLGKPWPEPWLGRRANGWTGKKHSHWSSLTLAAAYLLTTSDSLLTEIDNECELYLASHTLPSMGTLTTNNIGTSRAVGRSMLSMAWLHLCTGRTDIVDRMRDRAEQLVASQWDSNGATGVVRPCRIRPDSGGISVVGEWWSPWEEGLLAIGLEANYRVTGSLTAKVLAYTSALTVTWNGWDLSPDHFKLGYATRFPRDGAAFTAEQLQQPANCHWANSASFRYWCMPATKLALEFGRLVGDVPTMKRAEKILRMIDANRPVINGRWDDYCHWSAI